MMVYDNIVYVLRRIATLPAVVQESKPFLKGKELLGTGYATLVKYYPIYFPYLFPIFT